MELIEECLCLIKVAESLVHVVCDWDGSEGLSRISDIPDLERDKVSANNLVLFLWSE